MLIIAVSTAQAIPSPLCGFGNGETCKVGSKRCIKINYPPARAGDCAPCEMEGCSSCSSAKDDCSRCKAGYYPVEKKRPCSVEYGEGSEGTCTYISTCKRCKGSCGFCSGPKCQERALECKPHKVKTAPNAEQVRWRSNACVNRMGYYGNGYTRYYHAWIKDGKCMDCEHAIQYVQSDLDKTMACRVYNRALDVAANAWKGIDCVDEPSYTLENWCYGGLANFPFGIKSFSVVFSSTCRTKTNGNVEKFISSNGALRVDGDPSNKNPVSLVPSKRWTWAEAPPTTSSGTCKFANKYNLSPVSCPRFQLVTHRNCKLNSATLTNGEYFTNVFENFVPKWTISGDSSSATLESVRSCQNNTLTTQVNSKSGKISLSRNSSGKDTSFKIQPIGSFCTLVQLMRKSGGQNEFLTVDKDCVKVSWETKASERSQFKLERDCLDPNKSFYGDQYGCAFTHYRIDDWRM